VNNLADVLSISSVFVCTPNDIVDMSIKNAATANLAGITSSLARAACDRPNEGVEKVSSAHPYVNQMDYQVEVLELAT
jgi:hypothetical protein